MEALDRDLEFVAAALTLRHLDLLTRERTMEASTLKSIPPVVLLLFAATLSAEEWSVASPDGRTSITLARQADGRLSWRAAREKGAVVEDSPLGIRRAEQSFTTGL